MTILDHKPADYRFGGNCGVLAVAICAKASFVAAWSACKLKPGSKGGTNHDQRERALKALGVRFESKIPYLKTGNRYGWKTVRIFVREHTAPGVTYMLRVNKHVVSVRDGIVIDQSGAAEADKHWTKNMRVTRVTRILED